MKKLLIFLAVFLISETIFACTTFIISGRYTRDGKPVLYKHRDTGTLDNALVLFTDGKYDYIGLVDSNKEWKEMVWGGYNSAGFAIMNSAAYNNNIGDTTKFGDQEGVVMKRALMTCATLEDFEKLLKEMKKPLGVDANFGVIDARGGAAYYETGNFGFRKIDANDPAVAPFGYLVRTNFSFTGVIEKGAGFERYRAADEALYYLAASGSYEPSDIFRAVSRNLKHSLTGVNLRENLLADSEQKSFVNFEDFIPRYSSASVIMVVGAAKGEDPSSAMMWSITGFPLTTVALPVLLRNRIALPLIYSMKSNFHSPVCDAGLKLKENCFPIRRGSGTKYINIPVLLNRKGNGYLQQIEKFEQEIFTKAAAIIGNIQKGQNGDMALREFYKWIDQSVTAFYSENFGIADMLK
jgi:hypothetical protein